MAAYHHHQLIPPPPPSTTSSLGYSTSKDLLLSAITAPSISGSSTSSSSSSYYSSMNHHHQPTAGQGQGGQPTTGGAHQHQQQQRCDYCGTLSPSLLRCTRCKSSYYCNSQCQLSDWDKRHQTHCVERTEEEANTLRMLKTQQQQLPPPPPQLQSIYPQQSQFQQRFSSLAPIVPGQTPLSQIMNGLSESKKMLLDQIAGLQKQVDQLSDLDAKGNPSDIAQAVQNIRNTDPYMQVQDLQEKLNAATKEVDHLKEELSRIRSLLVVATDEIKMLRSENDLDLPNHTSANSYQLPSFLMGNGTFHGSPFGHDSFVPGDAGLIDEVQTSSGSSATHATSNGTSSTIADADNSAGMIANSAPDTPPSTEAAAKGVQPNVAPSKTAARKAPVAAPVAAKPAAPAAPVNGQVKAAAAPSAKADAKPEVKPKTASETTKGEHAPTKESGAGSLQSTRWKSQLCEKHKIGKCMFTKKDCHFAHGLADLRVPPVAKPALRKTVICEHWRVGKCRYTRESCPFAHGQDDMRS